MASLPSLPSPRLRAPNPFPALWTALLTMAILTITALGFSIGQWQRPIAGMLVDPFGRIDNYGWPSWSGYHQGLAYPDLVIAANDRTLSRHAGAELDEIAARAINDPARPIKILVEQSGDAQVHAVRAERLGFGPWMVLSGSYFLLAWVWLCAAGLLYTARPQSRAVGTFVRIILIGATLLLTLFDFHTTRHLVPIYLFAFACMPSALIEFGLCFPERLPMFQARPKLLWILRAIDVVLVLLLVIGYFRGSNYRMVCDLASTAAMVTLTVILSLRCATAHGRRRGQLLTALLVLLPIYFLLGALLLWSPERAAPYLFVAVLPLTVFGALGLAYALLRYDFLDSRTLLRRPAVRPLLTTSLSFVFSLLCALGFIGMRRHADALPIVYVLLAVAVAGPLLRRAAEWIDAKLFPTDVHYRDTVEQLSLRFTDLGSQTAVIEAVEQAVRQVVDCARVRLLPMQGPLWTPGSNSAGLGRFLPKVAQVMAAAIANEKNTPAREKEAPSPGSSSPSIDAESSDKVAATPTPIEGRNLRALRRIVKNASLFALTVDQEAALARGELVYLTPKAPLVSSVPALWSWLLIAVRFRDRIVGILAVAPKSVAQIFTQTSESLLRTIANHAALALYCASVSEQFESLHKTQEEQAHEQLATAMAALAEEVAEQVENQQPAGSEDLLISLRSISATRALKRQPQSLRPLVDRARQLLRDRLVTRLLEVDLLPALEVDCDGEALIQILSDLLANAIDACPSPGRIGIAVTALADQRLRLSLWDSGPSPLVSGDRLLPLISDTENRTAGLRLVIAQRLVRAHGWEFLAGRQNERNSADILIPTTEWRRRRPGEGSDEEDEGSGS